MLKLTSKLLFLLIALPISFNVSASCAKEDIDYYLEKGFSHDQITKLCSSEAVTTSKKNNSNYTSYKDEYADLQDEEFQKRMRIERVVFLRSSIAARNIQIRDRFLTYITEVCGRNQITKSGATDRSNIEGCALVKITIDLSSVEVVQRPKRERIFFGAKQIEVEGNISKEVVGGMVNLDKFERKTLKRIIENKINRDKNAVRIPIKGGLDFQYALESFNDIVNYEKQRKSSVSLENNMGGSLDDSDLNMTSGNDFIIEEDKGFEIKFSNDEDIEDEIIFEDIESQNNNSDIPDEVFN